MDQFVSSSARRYISLFFLSFFLVSTTCDAQDTVFSPATSSETVSATAPAKPTTTDVVPPPLAVRDQTRYALSPGDVLEITVYGVPELTQRVRINGSGDINLPLINSVHIGGMHIEDAQSKIEQALSAGNFLKNPHVNLLVTEYGSGVELVGEVSRPGIYPVLGSRRLFEVLAAAGGTTASAGRQVTIVNRANRTQRTVLLSNDPQTAMEADVLVYQGETIFVSRAGVVYVVGEVLQPSGFLMENRTEYTALRVVAMAHGTTKLAKLSQVKIIRKEGDSVTEIPVPLDQIVRSKSPDIKLQAEDILYVPTNKGKVVAQTAIQLAISLGMSAAFWSIHP